MAKTPVVQTYKQHSESQPRHLIALSDKEVFMMRIVMQTLMRAYLKDQKTATHQLHRDTGRLATSIDAKLKDIVDDIIKVRPNTAIYDLEIQEDDDAQNTPRDDNL